MLLFPAFAPLVITTPGQVPLTDGLLFFKDNIKRRPLVVVRAILAGIHDRIRS